MTHFNKGPSYGLSAEVKNKVRARAVWGRSAAGREGCEPPRRDVGAAREVRAPQLTEPARMRWPWLCSRAAARLGVPGRLESRSAAGPTRRLQDAPLGGRGRSRVVFGP